MLGFWIAAAIVSAATGAAMLAFARRAQRESAGATAPAVAAYERQLQEVDELAARGLLAPEEREAARGEAGRRLLQAARRDGGEAPAPRRRALWVAPAAAAGAPLLAMALYLAIGRPDAPDQPFRERVAAWRAEPERLGPAEAAAVLEDVVRERPRDPQAHGLLGRARLAAGDELGAVRSLEAAARLEPGRASRWTDLAQGLLALDTPDVERARRAVAQASALAPDDVDARYWRGRIEAVAGRPQEAAAIWRALAADLPAGDPRRAALEREIAGLQETAEAPAIEAMVEGLAARLRTQPDDPEGWARLARAYAVLGRERELQQALAEVRRRFAARPDVVARAEAEAEAGRRVQRAR